MAVEQLRSWQHDIVERCTHLTERIFKRYTVELPLPPDTMEIPNHVHRLRALVEHSMEDEVRAKVLLSAVHELNTYLYQDLVEQGPQGKTGTVLLFVAITIVFDKHLSASILMSISLQNGH